MAPDSSSASNLSKSASKKKSKRDAAATAQTTATSPAVQDVAASDGQENHDVSNGIDSNNESPYVKELQKTMRNVSKKLTAMQKVDSVIADNPGVTLDDLVASRKINADQKAQALKKPGLQSSLVQLEEQIVQYKKADADYQQRYENATKRLKAEHMKEIEQLQTAAKTEASDAVDKDLRQRLLILSRFLRAAAARRQIDNENTEESKAFEGVLLLLYGGDAGAVEAAVRLISGTTDGVISTDGNALDVTYERIKQLSLEYAPFAAEEAWVDGVAQAEQLSDSATGQNGQSQPAISDPTITHATLTELDTQTAAAAQPPHIDSITSPGQISVDDGAANAAGETWDSKGPNGSDQMADSWVSVPRDPQDTESPSMITATNSTRNWADEAPPAYTSVMPSAADASAPANDGFHEVHRGGRNRGGHGHGHGPDHRGGGRGRGGFRGDGRGRGGYRGDRGGDGGFRGRGRGGRGR